MSVATLDRPRLNLEHQLFAGLEANVRPSVLFADAPTTVLSWAEQHRRIDDAPFTLDRFRPLHAIYEDNHPRIVVMKPAQRGISEWAVSYTAFALDRGAQAWAPGKQGLNVAYLFPTQAALSDFSKERFAGLRRESPTLASMFGDDKFDAVTFKQVGDSYLYLRGAWSEAALRSFPADLLILDEFDQMDPASIALARRRLNASEVKREVAISTPTVPGKGVHRLYLASDRREWEQTCPACGDWVTLDFFRDTHCDGEPHATWQHWPALRLERATVAAHCPSCHTPWSDDDRCADGRWTAREPDVTTWRGYHIPALAFPFVNLRTLVVDATSLDPSERQEVYRSDLGLPYEPGGSRITSAMLAQLTAELPNGVLPSVTWKDVTMGVDVGSRFHYRVSAVPEGGGKRTVLAMGAVATWTDLDALVAHYGVRHAVIDAHPELHAARDWAKKHPGKVLRALYPAPSAMAGQLLRVNATEGVVQINRTMALDALYAAVAGAEERWPASVALDPEVVAHLCASVRVVSEDNRGQERAEWVHTAPDHHAHDCVYDRIAAATLPRRIVGGWA